MNYLPITLELQGQKCLIVGGGEIAARKLKTLLKANADVSLLSLVFSGAVIDIIKQFDAEARTQLIEQDIVHLDSISLNTYRLVIAATDNPMLNRALSVECHKKDILINVVDSLKLSSFLLPAIIDRNPLQIAISTVGVSPLLARKIREKIEWILPAKLGELFTSLKKIRLVMNKSLLGFDRKKAILENYIDLQLDEVSSQPQYTDNLENKVINQLLNVKKVANITNHFKRQSYGTVYLIGAGPGDPDLLTIKALKLLQKVDIVFYDSLVSQEVLELVRRDAKLVYVGKRAKYHSASQSEINQLLLDASKKYTRVIRLKGGDPFIFGRGGEELQILAKHQVSFEVVPGITAASGCASYSGIPLTHRDHSQSVHLVTAHQKNDDSSIDWNHLANKNQTLVFYMGLLKNQYLSEQLIKHGLKSSTPVAVIENGTRKNQRVVVGKISELSELVTRKNIKMPALIIVGDVVTLHKELSWFNLENSIESVELISELAI